MGVGGGGGGVGTEAGGWRPEAGGRDGETGGEVWSVFAFALRLSSLTPNPQPPTPFPISGPFNVTPSNSATRPSYNRSRSAASRAGSRGNSSRHNDKARAKPTIPAA